MDWFAKTVKKELERRGFKVTESENYTFEFIATDPKGREIGVKCKPHGHVYAPMRRELLSFGLPVYVASEKYVTDSNTHHIKIEEVK